ncbi:hypothetical protein RHSIM_Rhsim01G0092200 [Rhododendron simsii]|uniref:Uncharacterized protein n=1 Tax=Rhododendron simsii TaxID=118357 RepID=A0A834HHN6_RHOSS|nr:hypothetical protein RHSIM_Rhsim01G0092200 [Rhododendron simsii]
MLPFWLFPSLSNEEASLPPVTVQVHGPSSCCRFCEIQWINFALDRQIKDCSVAASLLTISPSVEIRDVAASLLTISPRVEIRELHRSSTVTITAGVDLYCFAHYSYRKEMDNSLQLYNKTKKEVVGLEVTVRRSDDDAFQEADVLHRSEKEDLAMLRTRRVGQYEFCQFGDTSSLQMGMPLFALIHANKVEFSFVGGDVVCPERLKEQIPPDIFNFSYPGGKSFIQINFPPGDHELIGLIRGAANGNHYVSGTKFELQSLGYKEIESSKSLRQAVGNATSDVMEIVTMLR